jgi:predicted kinase
MHADTGRDDARQLLDRAIGYLDAAPARLIAIAGLSGAGKSTVSRAVAPTVGEAPGAVILRSDIFRKRMMGVGETTKLPPAGYTPEMNDRVFAALAETAMALLQAGHNVIVDAVYGDPRYRAALASAAGKAGARLQGFWLDAPAAVLESRIMQRRGDASDAAIEVLRSQMEHVVRPTDWIQVHAARPVEEIAAEITAALYPGPSSRGA